MKSNIPQQLLSIVFIAIILTLLPGCISYYYAPNGHNVPLFEEKNEARLSLSGDVGLFSIGGGLQGSYALTDNIGLMVNGFYTSSLWDGGRDRYYNVEGYHVELGGGYFTPINNKFIFEVYGGFGKGEINNSYEDWFFGYYDDEGSSEVRFNRYFLQPAIGSTEENFAYALSLRLSALDYYSIIGGYDLPDEYIRELSYIARNRRPFFLEPAITIRFGHKFFWLQMQGGTSLKLIKEDLNYLNYEFFNINIGAYFVITDKYNKKKQVSSY